MCTEAPEELNVKSLMTLDEDSESNISRTIFATNRSVNACNFIYRLFKSPETSILEVKKYGTCILIFEQNLQNIGG